MEKHYIEPTLEIIEFRLTDVLTDSDDIIGDEFEVPIQSISSNPDRGLDPLGDANGGLVE